MVTNENAIAGIVTRMTNRHHFIGPPVTDLALVAEVAMAWAEQYEKDILLEYLSGCDARFLYSNEQALEDEEEPTHFLVIQSVPVPDFPDASYIKNAILLELGYAEDVYVDSFETYTAK